MPCSGSTHPAIQPSDHPLHRSIAWDQHTMYTYMWVYISIYHIPVSRRCTFKHFYGIHKYTPSGGETCFTPSSPTTLKPYGAPVEVPKLQDQILHLPPSHRCKAFFFDPIHSTHEKPTPPLNFVEPLVEWKTRVTRSGWKVCREWLKLRGPTKVPENEIQWKPCCTSGTTCATQYLLCEQGFLWRAPSTLYRPAAVASISLPLYIPWIPEKKMERIHQFDAQCVDSTRNIST